MSDPYKKLLALIFVWIIALPAIVSFTSAQEVLLPLPEDQVEDVSQVESPKAPELPTQTENVSTPESGNISAEAAVELPKEQESEDQNTTKNGVNYTPNIDTAFDNKIDQQTNETENEDGAVLDETKNLNSLSESMVTPTQTIIEQENVLSPTSNPGVTSVPSPTSAPTPTSQISMPTPTPTAGPVEDYRVPSLSVYVENNVGEFIYVGDLVIFTVKVENFGSGELKDAVIVHRIYNENSIEVGGGNYKLDTVATNTAKTQSFISEIIDKNLDKPSTFYSKTQIYGHAPNGKEYISSQENTSFGVRPKLASIVGQAESKSYFGVDSGSVLGQSTHGQTSQVAGAKTQRKDISPYMLTLFLSALWFLEKSKKWIRGE